MDDIRRELKLLRLAVAGLGAALVAVVALRPAAAASGELTLRRLAIVDANGVERVVLAAPLPDPILGGKRVKREGAISGIVLYDVHGGERGAYATAETKDDDANGAMLTLDEADGTQVVTAYANARGGAALSLNNENHDGVSLVTWRKPSMQVREGRRVIFKQPPDAPDSR